MENLHHVQGAAPPLTAVERFLFGQKNDALCTKKQVEYSKDRPIVKTTRGIEIRNDNKENMKFGQKKEKHLVVTSRNSIGETVVKGATRETKKHTYKNLIKGQWTAEEDMKLIRLVRQHGERKWVMISEKLVGRAGKQCRERWHNHLRPDINKEGWTEEEERVLVETHMRIGNKWAEIAKIIPGRTENSIKNHWNATNRRQNSKRKYKLETNASTNDSDLSPSAKRPCILQDYIKSIKNIDVNKDKDGNKNENRINVLSTPNLLGSIYSDGDSESSIIGDPYDEELVNLKNIFANHPISLENIGLSQTSDEVNQPSPSVFMIKNPNPNPNFHNNVGSHHQEETITAPANTSHIASDIYLSYLLNGTTSSSYTNPHFLSSLSSTSSTTVEEGGYSQLLEPQANSASERREMDLIEMLAGSSQGSNICFPLF